MNAQPFPPPMQATRALTCRAFSALIAQALDGKGGPQQALCASSLLSELSHTGLAEVTSTHESLTMRMFGITATGTSVPSLLRGWQSATADRLAQGVQR